MLLARGLAIAGPILPTNLESPVTRCDTDQEGWESLTSLRDWARDRAVVGEQAVANDQVGSQFC